MRIKLKYLLYRDVFYYKNLFYGAKLLGILDYDGSVGVVYVYWCLLCMLYCLFCWIVCGGGELSV